MAKKAKIPDYTDCYRTYISSDGYEILVGKNASDNDRLTFKVASANDFWLHVAPTSGSHVVVRNPDNEDKLPKSTLKEAAALAALFSKSKNAGRVAVNYCKRKFVKKARGAPAGQVQLQRSDTVKVSPSDVDPDEMAQ